MRRPDRHVVATWGRRSQQVLVLAVAVGVGTGLLVAGFERLTAEVLLHAVLELDPWWHAGLPLVGLLLATAIVRSSAGGGTATSDEYIRSFHDHGRRLPLRPVPGRLGAAVATLGLGGSLGYEGPAIYAGSAVGSAIQRRFAKVFSADDAKVLMVAGAAAGVAAIFKAPVTGLVFALEVPYQEDLARRMLLPAAIASAASYVTFASIAGTEPLLPVAGEPPFNLVDIGGSAAIGLACGVLARLFIFLIDQAKRLQGTSRPVVRVVGAGLVLAAVLGLSRALSGESLTLGPGYEALRWALEPDRALVAVAALGTLRVVATAATVAGGGVGGLFIPLVLQGAFVGRIAGGLFGQAGASLFPVVGIAAFLGAGYRVPLAAVVFVAEFTGRPGFVVPGLVAAVVSQLVMGRSSISRYQVASGGGHLERRLRLPIAGLVETDARTVPPDATVEEFFWNHLIATRQRAVPIVDGSRYLGMARADELAAVARDSWSETTVQEIALREVPIAAPGWHVGEAIRAMEFADIDRLPVCDGERFIGVISTAEVVRLDEILDRVEGSGADG